MITALRTGTARLCQRVLPSDGGLGARAKRGAVYSSLGFVGENALRLGGNLILTRLLFPEAFGLTALAQVIVTGLAMFSDTGTRAAIIQDERGDDPAFLDTAFVIQVVRGLLLWLIVLAMARPAAVFFDEPLLAAILPWAGLTLLIQGLNSTRFVTLNRHLTIGPQIALTLSAQIVGLIMMIGLALWLQSIWALVVGGLTGPTLIMILSHTVLPGHANRFRIERDALGRLFRFGRWIFLSTLAGFLVNQGDRVILGKLVDLDLLAFYNIAFFLATVPLMLMRKLSDVIFFPLYRAKPPTESSGNRNRLTRARALLVAGLLAMSTVLALGGIRIVDLLYDPRYATAGPLLVVLALAQMPSIVTGVYSMAPLAAGRSDLFALIVVVTAVLRTTVMVAAGLAFGVLGVAVSAAVTMLALYPVLAVLVRPYGVLTPRLDLAFGLLIAAIAVLALWFSGDAVAALSTI